MEYTTIHGTNMRPSRVGLRTWPIDWMPGSHADAAAIATIHRALDAGITLVDTSPSYGLGHAEELVGKALVGRRDRVLISTRAAALNRRDIDDSLRRLQTDCIDIYQVHFPDVSVPIEEAATTLRGLYDCGKIKAIGVNDFTPEQIDRFRRIAPLHTVQLSYNVFDRSAEQNVLPYAKAHLLSALTYGASCPGVYDARYLRAVSRLDDLARDRFGRRVVHLALRWVLDTLGFGVALWGAQRPEQVDVVDDAFGFTIDAETRREIDRIVREEPEEAHSSAGRLQCFSVA
jgi:aryl-alcohol dehydrogenase-like predicted oxidoreductase